MVKKEIKYIFVFGGVLSGLGKGIVASSLGYLLKSKRLQGNNTKARSIFKCRPRHYESISTW